MQALGILGILITWTFYAFICVGLGAWLPRATKSQPDLSDHLLAGLASLLAFLQLWHFVAPINFLPHITLVALGLLATMLVRKSTLYSVINTPRWAAIILTILALWLAYRATGPNAEYDAGLYHIQAIKWTETFRIVPGLANLHMRFGFSSTITLLAAFLDQGFWQGNAHHLTNGFFLAILAALIVRSAARTYKCIAQLADRLLLFTAPLLIDWSLDVQASSDSTDIGAAVLTILAAYYFVRTFAPGARRLNGFLCTFLAASAIAAKGSALFLCAPMIVIAFVLLRKQSLPSAITAALILLPWLARQTILTGYPLYPYPTLSLSVDWRMPIQKVEWLRHTLLNWARWLSYDDTHANFRWFSIWVDDRLLAANNLWKCLLPAAIAGPAFLIALFRHRFQRPAAWLLVCTFLAAIAWYFSAPDPRYASQFFILLMAIPLAVLLMRRAALVAAALLALLPFFAGRSLDLPQPPVITKTRPFTTSTGLTINIPVPPPGNTFEDRVWNAPLPAAPLTEIEDPRVPMPPLRLRRPPYLGDGFTRVPPP